MANATEKREEIKHKQQTASATAPVTATLAGGLYSAWHIATERVVEVSVII